MSGLVSRRLNVSFVDGLFRLKTRPELSTLWENTVGRARGELFMLSNMFNPAGSEPSENWDNAASCLFLHGSCLLLRYQRETLEHMKEL